jgi:hypothetical protein
MKRARLATGSAVSVKGRAYAHSASRDQTIHLALLFVCGR